jgi:hypothetical protein
VAWFATFRHPELGSGSYYLDVGSKMLKRVQHDGRGVGMTGGVGMTSRAGPSLCLCGFVRDTLAQLLALAGRRVRALWARAHP